MKKSWILLLALAGATVACSDSSGVDPDLVSGPELHAVRAALDSAFLHDTTLDASFTGDSGLYALMSALVFPFIDRASHIVEGGDTTRLVGIEFDIDATQSGVHITSNLTAILAWNGYDSTTSTVDTVFFLLGSGRAPVSDSLWNQFTLETAGTGTGFVIHQIANGSVTKAQSAGGHLRTTESHYGSGNTLGGGGTTFTVYKGGVSGQFTIDAAWGDASKDFGSSAHALKVKIRGSL
ncbi:MAG TPA: hypothetical protein VGU74_08670 [Gemmatimonadales bacterium]|nr:hypothetical protein [Gemmatimonadales bacterium]